MRQSVVSVLGLRRVATGEGSDDAVFWTCDLASEEEGVLEDFRVWLPVSDVARLPRPAAAADRWVEGQIDELVQQPNNDFKVLQSLSPLRLRP